MGLTVVDAGVVIGFLDANDSHHGSAQAALADARDRGDGLAIAASAYAESMVGPLRKGRAAASKAEQLFSRLPIAIVPIDERIAARAASLRARHGRRLRLPDALVVAVAVEAEADVLLTTDRGWPSRSALGLTAQLERI